MSDADAPAQSLEFLPEPSFLVRRHGEILGSNAAGRRLLGTDVVGRNLKAFVASAHDEFDAYLRRCSGSTAPLVGAAMLTTTSGTKRFRLSCAVLRDSPAGRTLVLRCSSATNTEFSVLSRQVQELHHELRARARENVLLQEALQQNRTLLRELQHRVKNNIQMMGALINMSVKGRATPQVAELVEGARLRLQAMATTQDAIYRAKQSGTVAAAALLHELLTSIAESFGVLDQLHLELTDAEVSSDVAHCITLIANELTTNAIKHGLQNQGGIVSVTFAPGDSGHVLVVQDNGPGIALDAAARSSGLKLVRGLCRQIGARLDIANHNGTICTVRFDVS